MFSKPHRGHSLHRLSCVAAGNVQATPCSLIMALIYLDRLSVTDPGYSCRITPQELFVVSLVSQHQHLLINRCQNQTVLHQYMFKFRLYKHYIYLQMISTKFYSGHDERFYLEDWASEGHMTEERLKEIELEFLSAMVNST